MRAPAFFLVLLCFPAALFAQHTTGTVSPGAFGSPSWRENGLAPGSLPLLGNRTWDVRLASDGHLYFWDGSAWQDLSAQGPQGPAGADGADGATWTSGTGIPTGGANGDLHLRTSTGDVYRNSEGSWSIVANLTGPAGATGSAGAAGPEGAAGADGQTLRNGSGAPSSGLGSDGDFYIDTASTTIYGPKTTGSWGSGTSLVGPAGATGPAGAAGPAGSPGAAATVTVGSTTTGAAGSVASVTNSGSSSAAVLDFTIPRGDTGATGSQGPAGATGATGATGPQGPAGPVAGTNTQVIFNDSGAAAGDAGFIYDKSADVATLGGARVTAAGTVSGASVSIVQAGTGLYQPATNALGLSANGVDVLRLSPVASAVNYVEILPQTTGGGSANGPTIKGTGSDSSVDLNFDTKGSSGRYQWKIGGVTKMDFTDIGSGFALRNSTGPITVQAGKYTGSDSNNAVVYANGGNWVEVKANGTVALRAEASAVTTYFKSVTAAQSLTISDNGNGSTRATATLTPTTSYVACTCSDPQGCDVAVSESGAVDGQSLRIVGAGSNVCGFADASGVTEMAGNFDVGQFDSLSFIYSTDRWVEVSRSNN